MNQIVSLFMFSCGDYEKVNQSVISGSLLIHLGQLAMMQ